MKGIHKIQCCNTAVDRDTDACKCRVHQYRKKSRRKSSVPLAGCSHQLCSFQLCAMLLFITDVGWVKERPAVWHPDIIHSAKINDINKSVVCRDRTRRTNEASIKPPHQPPVPFFQLTPASRLLWRSDNSTPLLVWLFWRDINKSLDPQTALPHAWIWMWQRGQTKSLLIENSS